MVLDMSAAWLAVEVNARARRAVSVSSFFMIGFP
jgi:hypothetical protein